MNETFEMAAKTFQGLEGVLADELTELGAENVEVGRRIVSFCGDKRMLYRANFCLRTALRILKPVFKFEASDADSMYEIARKFEWDKMLSVDQTFAIDSTVNSDDFRHSRFVTYRVKDAIADYFNEKYGKRPSIRIQNADINIDVHIAGNQVTISLDSSGESLHKRGYRVAQTEAPINEVLAAGLLKLAGWKGESNLIDPMCGSGTFLIEAALMATNVYPGVFREHFAFEQWPDFDAELFEEIYNDDSQERDFNFKIYGSDISPKAIAATERNIKSARVGRYGKVEVKPLSQVANIPAETMLISNPPYGERIGYEDMEAFYDSIGSKLKEAFKGCSAWLIGPKNEIFDAIGLKPSVKYPVLNGSLECELRQYVIFDGTYAQFRKEGNSVKNEEFKRSEPSMSKRFRGGRDAKFKESDKYVGNKDAKGGKDGEHRSADKPWKRRDGDKPRSRRFGRRDDAPAPKNALEEYYRKPYAERFGQRRNPDDKPADGEAPAIRGPRKPMMPFREPTLGADAERTIVHGRRNSWKRSGIEKPADNNDKSSDNNE